jgi:hypothetical protein
MNKYNRLRIHASFYHAESVCFKSVIQSGRVSRNRYGVEKTVDTHTILINAIKVYVCLQEI